MNWQVFTELSTLQVQIHWVAAIASLVFGIGIFIRKKGTASHKLFGRTYVVCMVITSLSAFFIRQLEPGEVYSLWTNFSAIHLLIPFTLTYLFLAVRAIRKGNVKSHKLSMIFAFVGGIVIAGAFTFIPGRHMHSLFFGDPVAIQKKVDSGYKH